MADIRPRNGYTLIELVIALAVIALLTAVGVPAFNGLLDGIAVRSASAEAHAMFGLARQLAVLRGTMAALEIDTSAGRLAIRSGPDVIRLRELGDVHGVRLAASRLTTTYAPNGIGFGVSNLTLVVQRGAAADTLVVSRLGRVRRQR